MSDKKKLELIRLVIDQVFDCERMDSADFMFAIICMICEIMNQ